MAEAFRLNLHSFLYDRVNLVPESINVPLVMNNLISESMSLSLEVNNLV